MILILPTVACRNTIAVIARLTEVVFHRLDIEPPGGLLAARRIAANIAKLPGPSSDNV